MEALIADIDAYRACSYWIGVISAFSEGYKCLKKISGIKNMNERSMLLDILKEYFKDKDDVLLAFIFGSSVKDRLTKKSDIDIAVLFKRMPDFKEVLRIADDLSELVKREIDIVILNNSSPIIRMQVLKNGVLVVNKDKAIYNDFFVRTIKEYDDLKHVRKESEENILRGRIYA